MKIDFKIKKFIKSTKDNTDLYDKIIREAEKNIAKLEPNAWNDYYYKIGKEERKIAIFNEEATIVRLKVTDVEYSENSVRHKKEFIPSGLSQRTVQFVCIWGKIFKIDDYAHWYIEKVPENSIEEIFIKMTPEYKKAEKYISGYSKKEINKIVKHLEDRFEDKIFCDEINKSTDPAYWY